VWQKRGDMSVRLVRVCVGEEGYIFRLVSNNNVQHGEEVMAIADVDRDAIANAFEQRFPRPCGHYYATDRWDEVLETWNNALDVTK